MKSLSQEDKKHTILIVEDVKSLREGLALNLKLNGYNVITAADGDQGMKMAFNARPDLIILDIMMPGWNGLEILDELRKHEDNVPVLILSALNSTSNKVEGLDIGADDYMTKPFDLPELIARVEVMLRRLCSERKKDEILSVGNITVNRSERSVKMDGEEISLSAKEFDILFLLAETPEQPFTRETILERVWGWDYEGTARTVDNFVASLRKKIDPKSVSKVEIKTVPKIGYKLKVQKQK